MSKETNVERAKLAEQAERYDDMAKVSLQASAELHLYSRRAGGPEGNHIVEPSAPQASPKRLTMSSFISVVLVFFAVDEAGNGEWVRAIK